MIGMSVFYFTSVSLVREYIYMANIMSLKSKLDNVFYYDYNIERCITVILEGSMKVVIVGCLTTCHKN